MSETQTVAIVLEDWPEHIVETVLELLEGLSYHQGVTPDGKSVSYTRDDRPPAFSFTPDGPDLDFLHAAWSLECGALDGKANAPERRRYMRAREVITNPESVAASA